MSKHHSLRSLSKIRISTEEVSSIICFFELMGITETNHHSVHFLVKYKVQHCKEVSWVVCLFEEAAVVEHSPTLCHR